MFCISCCQNLRSALGKTVWTWGVLPSGHGPSAAAALCSSLSLFHLELALNALPAAEELIILPAALWRGTVNLNKRPSGAEQAWSVVPTLFLRCCTKGGTFLTGSHLELTEGTEVWKLISNLWHLKLLSLHFPAGIYRYTVILVAVCLKSNAFTLLLLFFPWKNEDLNFDNDPGHEM